MNETRASQVWILAEDIRQEQFIRRFLYRLGYQPHHLRFSRERGGITEVLNKYPLEVVAFRKRSAKTTLIVVVDADGSTVEQRLRELADRLTSADVPQRNPNDRIANFVPKRTIETWVLCLNGAAVDETTNCKQPSFDNSSIRSASERFFDWSRSNAVVPSRCIESLKIAFQEVARLEE